MKRLVWLCSLLLIVILAVAAGAQQSDPAIGQILDKYVASIGGKAALEKLNSRVSTGTIELIDQGLTFPVEIYAKAPDKRLIIVDAGENGLFQQAFDGAVAWASLGTGITEMTGGDLANARRGSVFQGALEIRKIYPKLSLVPDEKVGDTSAKVILGEPGDGAKVWLFFDPASGLLLRTKIDRDSPQEGGRTTSDIRFEDYREQDGVKIPFVIRQSSPSQSYVVRLNTVKNNVEIADSKFAKPTAQ